MSVCEAYVENMLYVRLNDNTISNVKWILVNGVDFTLKKKCWMLGLL